MDVRQYL